MKRVKPLLFMSLLTKKATAPATSITQKSAILNSNVASDVGRGSAASRKVKIPAAGQSDGAIIHLAGPTVFRSTRTTSLQVLIHHQSEIMPQTLKGLFV